MHAIGSSFGGLLGTEPNGDNYRIKVMLEVNKPLTRGIFIHNEDLKESWVPFKYERLLRFCFGCGRMRHGLKDCMEVVQEVKELLEDALPYSLVFKTEFNFSSNTSIHLGVKSKSLSTQHSYLGDDEDGEGYC